jgi:hypothetical protein
VKRNRAHKGMFTPSQASRLGLLALAAALGCVLRLSASAQNNNRNRAQKAQPRATPTPPRERKTTPVNKSEAVQMVPGELKGRVNFYNKAELRLYRRGCFNVSNTGEVLDSGSSIFGPATGSGTVTKARVVLVGFLTKGKDGKEDNVSVPAGCSYSFEGVPPGTYKLRAYVVLDITSINAGGWGGSSSTEKQFFPLLPSFLTGPVYDCTKAKDLCHSLDEKEVTIQPGKTTTLDVSVEIPPEDRP